MGTIRCDLYSFLSRQSLLFAQGALCVGVRLLRFSHLLQTTSDLLFACTPHTSAAKKASAEISRPYPGSLLAHASSGLPCGSRCMEFAYHLRRTDYKRRCRRTGTI